MRPLRKSLWWSRRVAVAVHDGPEILGIKFFVFEDESSAAVSKAKIGSLSMPGVLDLFKIIAALSLVDIHMDMPGEGALFPEHQGSRGFGNGGHLHSMRPAMLVQHAVISRHKCFAEVIIEAIDKITAVGAVISVSDKTESVTWAGDDFPVDVIRLQFIWPGVGWQVARRQLLVIIIGVHSCRQKELAVVV